MIKVIAKIAFFIFLYYCIYSLYAGLINPVPAWGDSWDYHIPISKSILDGSFINLANAKLDKWYFPGSSEAINSLFILLNIPLTLSNLFATICLFFCCWKLGMVYKLNYYSSLVFAVTFCSLNVIVRWMNAVSIDVWLAVFFVISIILLENPKKSLRYFIYLGFSLGMVVGSKLTGWLFVGALVAIYSKQIIKVLNVSRFVAFFIPFLIFGLFWYIRNYLLVGNPFYPVSLLGFKGNWTSSGETFLKATVSHPIEVFNAFFGEYKLWVISVFVTPAYIIFKYIKRQKKQLSLGIEKIFIIGLINLLLFTQFPTWSDQSWILVSTFRYSYPVFIPLMLGVFLLASKYKKMELLGYFVIANMIFVTTFAYYPKLVIFYFPIGLFLLYLIDKYSYKFKD